MCKYVNNFFESNFRKQAYIVEAQNQNIKWLLSYVEIYFFLQTDYKIVDMKHNRTYIRACTQRYNYARCFAVKFCFNTYYHIINRQYYTYNLSKCPVWSCLVLFGPQVQIYRSSPPSGNILAKHCFVGEGNCSTHRRTQHG